MAHSCKQRCENLIISLKVIGKLTGDDKLIFRHRDVIIQKQSTITSITRYIVGDGRKETISGLRTTLDDVESVVNDFIQMSNSGLTVLDKYVMLCRLNISLQSVINKSGYGILSLLITYKDDPVAIANLESVKERISLLQKEIKKVTDKLKSENNYESDSSPSEE